MGEHGSVQIESVDFNMPQPADRTYEIIYEVMTTQDSPHPPRRHTTYITARDYTHAMEMARDFVKNSTDSVYTYILIDVRYIA